MISVLPPGGEDLRGHEADTIISFKNSLGIDDPDAATVHVEVSVFHLFSRKIIKFPYFLKW